ncbi:MAG: type II toxin-antitoxin system HicB family antitoxin [Nanoarchaeota archaeon]
MAKELILSLTVRKEGNRYWAWCPELDVSSEGKTTEDARDNLREAVQCHIETMIEQGDMELLLEKLGLTRGELDKDVVIPRVLSGSFEVPLSVS